LAGDKRSQVQKIDEIGVFSGESRPLTFAASRHYKHSEVGALVVVKDDEMIVMIVSMTRNTFCLSIMSHRIGSPDPVYATHEEEHQLEMCSRPSAQLQRSNISNSVAAKPSRIRYTSSSPWYLSHPKLLHI
jgi:hypothetical protein